MKNYLTLAALALLAAGCNQSSPQPRDNSLDNQPPIERRSDKETYRNATYGFEFAYPADMAFVTPSYASLQDKIVEITTKSNLYPETNFGDAAFSVSAQYARTLPACLALGHNDPEFGKEPITINGVNFYLAKTTGAAAGNLYQSTLYRTLAGKATCLELMETVHTTNIGNYEPGTVTEVDQGPIKERLDGILNSFKFTE